MGNCLQKNRQNAEGMRCTLEVKTSESIETIKPVFPIMFDDRYTMHTHEQFFDNYEVLCMPIGLILLQKSQF